MLKRENGKVSSALESTIGFTKLALSGVIVLQLVVNRNPTRLEVLISLKSSSLVGD
jgi:hypothetical protein